MASDQELSHFLAGIEKRAFKQAVYAVRDDQAALDIVQDAMIRLAEKYGDQPVEESAPLFQRILHNLINDWFRRSKVRNHWVTLFSNLTGSRPDGEEDIAETDLMDSISAKNDEINDGNIENALGRAQVLQAIEEGIEKLPARQREAFLLRYWEEFDVAETAQVMGCSEGSVKTHCSRAVAALSKALRNKGISL
ncbi:MAG: RNA polymerase sigma factor [Candidatus Protistobacter heckmanni]|nr:RNA polymerase sigma factor [Candidatus Protistobacter heckmanni]